MMIRRFCVPLAIAMLLAASGCTDTDPGAPAAPAGTGAAMPTAAATPARQGVAPTRKRNIIAWLRRLGLGTPRGPQSDLTEAYDLLGQRKCADVIPLTENMEPATGRLFAGAAQACLAAFDGRTELWPSAESALEQAGGPDSVHCLNVPVYDLLDQLVKAHRADPKATFEVGEAGPGGEPPCPTITRLQPDHGLSGDKVTIVGDNLDKVHSVFVEFNGEVNDSALFERNAGPDGLQPVAGGLQFIMPPAPESATAACVRVQAEVSWSTDEELFTLDRPGPSASSSVGPPPSPSASASQPAVSPAPPDTGESPAAGGAGRSRIGSHRAPCPAR
ncbi:IPT/TIG domain-containing protein [Catellatospora chokoriensis]|uniref:IPT/TIG domain-containing protein n=1 Tax=Catellatospora chokoriensis TaxID=310353 RepID=A0A8J3NVJ5_9ACTN|nr:IPT/TIG domain-containing protein [Catellatospora chokoriensis]GIF94135.1 hypothetical protein Cch02nite_75790 [Catellatospora chokoriensis]